ncbi:sodium-dependent lysophosphatidylcholine symporter 1-B-like isoform X2 [Ctenopharyngodon idella]|uniref:sodium-dependent lysophosphatidylcholine symporter 1-B-like isoform X2 n=1 Tax=Ctenopharyngodon idella TaxID=7959 RepID=UPI00222FCA0E|nr:sodium-dependent lysophosphatidylcholine symporter 1-B-like isoform X2 [Ctenopharyngodon idella]
MPSATTRPDKEQSAFTCITDEHGNRKTEESQETSNKVRLALSRKLCYAVGGVPYQMTNIAMGFSLQIFLLDVVQMEAFSVSLILFISHAWDAVTDPLVGYLVSRSRWTQIGKLLPCATVFHIRPSTCFWEEINKTETLPQLTVRTFKHSYWMSVEALAMLMAAMIQGQVLWVYNKDRDQACLNVDQAPDLPHSTALHETRSAFMISALVVSALFFVCCMVLFLGVKEQKGPHSDHMHTTYLNALKKLIGHVSYQRLVLGFLFSTLAFQMSLGNFTLFCTHVAGLGAQFQYLMLAILVAATISVPMWQMTLVKLGKKMALFIGLPLLIPALVVLVAMSENFPVYTVMCVLVGASLAALFLLPWSMLPDVVDEFAVQNPSCKGLEPLFYSCSRFCNKLGGGLSAGISTMTLHFTGYKAGACSHADGVILALKLLLAPIPITSLLVGLVFFYLYPINEARRKQIQQDLGHARSNSATLSNLETERFPISQQIYEPSQSFIFKSKPRITSHLNANKSVTQAKNSTESSPQKHCNTSADSHDVRMSSFKSANQFHKSRAYPTSSQQHNSSVKHHESKLSETQATRQLALKFQDIPDDRSKVTWV